MSLPIVVHVNQPYDVYIGRANSSRNLKASIWGNPFKEGADGTREQVIFYYEVLLRMRLTRGNKVEYWKRELLKLGGQKIACWCKPKPCHGDPLVILYEELFTTSKITPPSQESLLIFRKLFEKDKPARFERIEKEP